MKSTVKSIFTTITLASLFLTGCAKYEESLKFLPNELAIADDCRNVKRALEIDCYDLISYKNSFAQLRLGLYAQSKGEYPEAFQRYNIAKQKGNFYANALLADLYNRGYGVEKNEKMVLDLLDDTKEIDPISAYKLAYHYMEQKDYSDAIELFTFAATNDVKNAQNELSKIYASDEFGQMDVEKSNYWAEQYEDKTESFIKRIYGI